MRAAEWQRYATTHLAPVLPDYLECRGRLIFRQPVEHVLVGCIADQSAFDSTTVELKAFAMPMFVPSEHLVLSYGFPLSRGRAQVTDAQVHQFREALLREFVPFAAAQTDVGSLLEIVPRLSSWNLEVHAYGQLLLGRDMAALSAVDQLVSDISLRPLVRQRASVIRRLLQTGGPPSALEQLLTWEALNREQLRLG